MASVWEAPAILDMLPSFAQSAINYVEGRMISQANFIPSVIDQRDQFSLPCFSISFNNSAASFELFFFSILYCAIAASRFPTHKYKLPRRNGRSAHNDF